MTKSVFKGFGDLEKSHLAEGMFLLLWDRARVIVLIVLF